MTSEDYGMAFRKGFPFTVRFLGLRGLPRDVAEEAAQAAWVTGWERLHQLRDQTRLLQWVASIALNTYRKMLRHSRRDVALTDREMAPHANDATIDVHSILGRCAGKQRELLEIYHLKGMDVAQIASHYSCSKTAVRIRLSRARKMAAKLSRPTAAVSTLRH